MYYRDYRRPYHRDYYYRPYYRPYYDWMLYDAYRDRDYYRDKYLDELYKVDPCNYSDLLCRYKR